MNYSTRLSAKTKKGDGEKTQHTQDMPSDEPKVYRRDNNILSNFMNEMNNKMR